MELILFLSALLLFFFMALKILKQSNPITLPPGPKTLPIIGNMLQLFGPLLDHILWDLAKQYRLVMHSKLGEISTFIVSSLEVAKQIMNEQDIIVASRPSLLGPKILIYNCYDIDLSHVITAKAGFGKRNKYQEDFEAVLGDVVKLMGPLHIADMFPSFKLLEVISGRKQKLENTHKKIDGIMENIIKEHKEKRKNSYNEEEEEKEDFVNVLFNIQETGDIMPGNRIHLFFMYIILYFPSSFIYFFSLLHNFL
ncbi:hypothetical protein M9H77_17835 [Catharanthus roseus]|uniref:Uncharacterized protein n=1 Tax=Catharanthus roseus TaxID=4058 RepID=A0ACC0B5Q0_CATRO|nr:hypothetical protein M9H77_17835 [Catharanthus roseus]